MKQLSLEVYREIYQALPPQSRHDMLKQEFAYHMSRYSTGGSTVLWSIHTHYVKNRKSQCLKQFSLEDYREIYQALPPQSRHDMLKQEFAYHMSRYSTGGSTVLWSI